MSRVLVPQAGTIRLAGRDLARLRRPEVAWTLAVVPQDVTLTFPFTVREFVQVELAQLVQRLNRDEGPRCSSPMT